MIDVGASFLLKLIATVWKVLVAICNKMKLWFFNSNKVKSNNDPVQLKKALMIAQGLTFNPIVKAVFFENLKEKSKFLLMVSKENPEDWANFQVSIYQKAGEGQSLVWYVDDIYISQVESVRVVSLLNDGYTQIFIFSSSHGTGAGVDEAVIFCTKRKKEYHITESFHHSSMSTISSSVSAINIDHEIKDKAIEFVKENGMLRKAVEVDFESPDFAVNKWLYDNGEKYHGKVKSKVYSGRPRYNASIVIEKEYDDSVWTAYFKGPLFLYDKNLDIHQVVFANYSGYSWVNYCIGNKDLLMFVTHMPSVLMLFSKIESDLLKFCEFNNEKIEDFQSSSDEADFVDIITPSGRFFFSVDLLKACQPYCLRTDPHYHAECGYPPKE